MKRLSFIALVILAVWSAVSDWLPFQAKTSAGGPSHIIGQITGWVIELRPLREVTYQQNDGGENARLVFDDTFAYLVTPDGLFRLARDLNAASPLEMIGFERKQITNLYVHNNVLYVLKHGEQTRTERAIDHSFLRSEDQGRSFIPMDEGLEECFGGHCGFLTPTHAVFKDGLIFLNAGGGNNLQVTPDHGKSWIALSGQLKSIVCSDPAIEIISEGDDRRALIGGECPLDFAYLERGMLRQDMLGWAPNGEPRRIEIPEFGNRNVMVIKQRPNSSLVLAGIEGALLRSMDYGQSFAYAFRYPISGGAYPCITHILYPARWSQMVIISGFDKAKFQPFLAYSPDDGAQWIDISFLAQTNDDSIAAFVTEDATGRVVIGVMNHATNKLTLSEVVIAPALQRPSREPRPRTPLPKRSPNR
jgi:hypothetical protein